jgi:hypothetical protein
MAAIAAPVDHVTTGHVIMFVFTFTTWKTRGMVGVALMMLHFILYFFSP